MITEGHIENNYRFLRQLGVGGFGQVWLARNTIDGKLVAIKIASNVDPKAREDVDHEIQALQFLLNQGLCAEWSVCILGTYHVNGELRIVLEYIDGHTLVEDVIKVDIKDRLQNTRLLYQTVMGLDALHKAGISHQDIKLENVMWDSVKKRYVYIDVGTACLKQQCCVGFCGSGPGTAYAFPPEMCRRVGKWTFDLTRAHDIWSLGITLAVFYKSTNRTDYLLTVGELRELCEQQEFTPDIADISLIDEDDPYYAQFEQLSEILGLMLTDSPTQRLQNWNLVVEKVKQYANNQIAIVSMPAVGEYFVI